MKKNNTIVKRLRKMASADVEILDIDYGPYQSTILKFRCDAKDSREAATKVTQYFLGSGKSDATKFIQISRWVFGEIFSNDSEIAGSTGNRIFKNTNGLTLDGLIDTMPASEIADLVTEGFYFDNIFQQGSWIEYDKQEDCWYLTP